MPRMAAPAAAAWLAPALLIAGCSGAADGNAASAPDGAAVDRNESSPVEMPFDEPPLPAPAVPAGTDTPDPAPPPAEAEPVEPAPDNAEAPAAEPGRAEARAHAEAYFAAIARRDYGSAFAMWEPGAVGASRAQFARRFARYRRYDATVGRPGRIDAGAGQRYVTVPVEVRMVLTDGRRETAKGALVLHRTAAIDGATADQRRWRIRDFTLDGR